MRRKALLAAVIILVPAVQGLSLNEQKITESESDLIQVSTLGNSTIILDFNNIRRYDDTTSWKRSIEARAMKNMDFNENYVITGTRVTGSDIFIYNVSSGNIVYQKNAGDWIDDVALYEKDQPVFVAVSSPFIKKIENFRAEDIGYPITGHPKHVTKELYHLDNDSEKEGLVGHGPKPKSSLEAFNLKGEREWEREIPSDGRPHPVVTSEGIATSLSDHLALLRKDNGSTIWKIETEGKKSKPIVVNNQIFYSNQTHAVFRDFSSKISRVKKIDEQITRISKHPQKPVILGFQSKNLSVYNTEGEKLASKEIGKLDGEIDFYPNGDVSVRTDREVFRVSFESEEIYSGEYFYGSGKPMLEAVSLNKTAFIGDERQEFRDLSNKNLTEADEKTVPKAFDHFNVSKKWYVDSREKAVYAAALAARENATITFEKDEADRDLSDLTVKQLKQKFRDRFNPNHLVVADFDSESGVLATQMAVRKGYMPINYEGEIVRKKDPKVHNSVNNVELIDRKIEQEFDEIGYTWKSVSEGRYVTLLDAPRKAYEDPVNGLFRDSRDGEVFYSDTVYGNLDEDKKLEAAVGRYPDDTSTASAMFYSSTRREKGDEALVASEYLHQEWPIVLATLGGGVLSGSTAEEIFEKEGYSTTHLVERRADLYSLLKDLIGVPGFIGDVNDAQSTMSKVIGDSSAKLFKNTFLVIKGLEYAEEGLKVYLEYEWDEYSQDFEVELPEEASVSEFKELVQGVLPERHSAISESNLKDKLSNADMVYYTGKGSDEEWNLPSENSYKTSFRPEDVPEMNKSMVLDSSGLGAIRNARMRNTFLESGATNYIGFSSVNYHSYSSKIANNFFGYGKTAGKSFLEGVNSLRSNSIIYSPASSYKIGVREKMEKSPTLYGNPETVKDPLNRSSLNFTKTCENGICNVNVTVNPEPEIRNGKYVFNTTDYALKPFHPVIPLFSFSRSVPEGSQLISKKFDAEYVSRENVSVPDLKLLSTNGNFRNHSVNYTEFPEKKHGFRFGDRINYVQPAQQVRENSTRLLESADLQLKYQVPLSVEVVENRDGAGFEVYSDRKRNLSVSYTVDGDTNRTFAVVDGSKEIALDKLEPGVHEVKVTVFNQDLQASDEETLKVGRDLNVYLFAPDIDAGSERAVRVIVENPNRFSLTKDLKLEVSGSAALSVLEKPVREIKVSGESSKSVKWRLIGVERGKAVAKISNNSREFRVEKARNSERLVSTEKIHRSALTAKSKVNSIQSSQKSSLTIESSGDRFQISQSSSYLNASLSSGSFRSELVKKPEKTIQRVSTPEGEFVRAISKGQLILKRKGLEERRAEKILYRLRQEYQKFDRYVENTPDETKVLQTK